MCQPKTPASVLERAAQEKALAAACDEAADEVRAGHAVTAPALPHEPRFRAALDDAARRAYECRAVATNGDAACAAIAGAEKRDDCAMQRALFHAARAAPSDRSWRFPDAWHAHCRQAGAGAACDAYRDALRAGDPAKCPKAPAALADCPALAALDPARCPDADCAARVARDRLLTDGGLAQLAESGAPEERVLAAAALGRPDACEPTIASFVAVCRSASHVGASDGGQP